MRDPLWRVARGSDLVELHRDGSLSDDLPKCQAVYLWKWKLRPSSADHVAPKPFATWLTRLLETPHGSVTSVRLAHFLHLSRLELRGGSLPEAKRRALEKFLAPSQNRNWMKRFLIELAPMSVGLYVGETLDLPSRIKQHLDGDTDFGLLLRDHPIMEWESLDLHYCDLGPPTPESTEIRKTIEYLTAVLAVAGFTQRPG